MKKRLNIVWLKRDLRTQDHAPFWHAEYRGGCYVPIYIFEPSVLAYPDSALSHQQFIYHSILDMNARLEKFKRSVIIFHAEAIDVFTFLCEEFSIAAVFSYQESGVRYTWNRDKQVSKLLQEKKCSG